jgi:peptidoglycan/LPS O-acetylase OafA/YrhL
MKRLPQLDILRGIAILMVLGSHPVAKLDEAGWFRPLAHLWSYAGWTGVNLFFVLSGFLVGGLLFAEWRATGRLNPGRFMLRRMFKIWPSYYIFICLLIAITSRAGADPRMLFPFFLHVQNYHGVIGTIAPHTWSLAVEEHFYVLLPLLLSVVGSRRALALMLAVCLLGCAVWRGIDRVDFPTVATHHNLDSLAFGVLLGYLYHFQAAHFRKFSSHSVPLLTVGLSFVGLGLVPGTQGSRVISTIVPVLLYLGYGTILIAMLGLPADRGVSGRFFRGRVARLLILVGVYSYSIYVWHIDIAYRLVDLLAGAGLLSGASPSLRWPTLMAGYVLLAVGAGVLCGRCIEVPALALRDRLLPRQNLAGGDRSGDSCADTVSGGRLPLGSVPPIR